MLAGWKRLLGAKSETPTSHNSSVSPTNNNDGNEQQNSNADNATPFGVEKLNKHLQAKFRNGIDYNLKILIIGDTKVGKTSLFQRLKNEPFNENYTPSEDLKVTSIDWNYKTNKDVVKIDIWEVVETAVRKSPVPSQTTNDLKKSTSNNRNNNNSTSSAANSHHHLDNSSTARPTFVKLTDNIDIFKNANAVILMFNMEKTWTYKYIQNEILKIPKELPILILANFRDMSHHRTVTAEQVELFIKNLDRSVCDGRVMYAECSMKNGYGMKVIDKFFNIPFLKLQEFTILKQLELNRQEFLATIEELSIMRYDSSVEYEQFLELERIRRRKIADAMSPVNNANVAKLSSIMNREQIRNSAINGAEVIIDKSKLTSIESKKVNPDKKTDAQLAAEANFKNDRLPSIVMGAKNPLPETKIIQITKQSYVNEDATTTKSNSNDVFLTTIPRIATKQISKETETRANDNVKKEPNNDETVDSEDDEDDDDENENDNPLVADFGTELDSDD